MNDVFCRSTCISLLKKQYKCGRNREPRIKNLLFERRAKPETHFFEHEYTQRRMKRLIYILIVLLPMMGWAQDVLYDLRGTILDSDSGKPIVGACITICGTHRGTISDFDGVFEFENTSDGVYVTDGDQLVISHVGYRPQMFYLDCLRPTIYLDRDTINICTISCSSRQVIHRTQQMPTMECGYTQGYRQDSNGQKVYYESPREVIIDMSPRIPIRRDSLITEAVRKETRQQNINDSLRNDSICRVFAEKYPDQEPEEMTGPERLFVLEEHPKYKSGNEMLCNYLTDAWKGIRWPRKMQTIRITFVVGKDGKISQVTTMGKLPKKAETAIVRSMENMPEWEPGRQLGRSMSMVCAIVAHVSKQTSLPE